MLASILRASARNPVNFLSGTNFVNAGSDASRSLTLNTGFRSGHILVAMTANRTTTAPTLLSGYTSIVVINANATASRSLRLQYKTATGTSETITWTGAYGYLLAFENIFKIGKTATRNTTAAIATSQPIPDLTGLEVSRNSYILASSFSSSGYLNPSSPYTLLGDYAAVVSKNTNSSLTGEVFNTSGSNRDVSFAVEFLVQ